MEEVAGDGGALHKKLNDMQDMGLGKMGKQLIKCKLIGMKWNQVLYDIVEAASHQTLSCYL